MRVKGSTPLSDVNFVDDLNVMTLLKSSRLFDFQINVGLKNIRTRMQVKR